MPISVTRSERDFIAEASPSGLALADRHAYGAESEAVQHGGMDLGMPSCQPACAR